MNRPERLTMLLLSAVLCAFPSPLAAAPAAALGGDDVGELLRLAGDRYDLATADAIVLLDGRSVDLTTAGTRRTTIHRIVWIATENAVNDYADVRVQHHAQEGALEVLALRTWRDGRFWPDESRVAPTAVVETLPFEIAAAADYSDRRETMLLHDGVELPCVLEVAYAVTDDLGPAESDDGLVVFAGSDPTVRSRFSLAVRPGTPVSYVAGNGAPATGAERVGSAPGPEPRADTYEWRLDFVDRLPRPLVADPIATAPYVAWSTWPSWDTLAASLNASEARADTLSQALRDSLAWVARDAPTPPARARAVVSFVTRTTRFVNYDDDFARCSPRTANRVWETAYAHRLDRAVLAGALFRAAGLDASPCYRSLGFGAVDPSVPGLARFGGVQLLVQADGFDALYDPSAGTLEDVPAAAAGRSFWVARPGRVPEMGPAVEPGGLRVVVTLEGDENGEGGWVGKGVYDASGPLSPHAEVSGIESEASDFLGRVASALLQDAEVTDHSIERLDPGHTTAGFTFTLPASEPDDQDRTKLVLGEPAGGLLAALPPDVHLYEEKRASPVLLSAPMEQEVELRFDPGDREVVYLPAERAIENALGRFALEIKRERGQVSVRKYLAIRGTSIAPGAWADLRALLLAETDARSSTVCLK